MIAGGTGITPMLQVRWSWVCRHEMLVLKHTRVAQVIAAVLKDPGDKTKVRAVPRAERMHAVLTRARCAQVSLIFANQTEDDILCRTVRPA